MPDETILVVEQVSLAVLPPYEAGLEHVSLTLKRGDLLLIRTENGHPHSPLADVVSGLVEPAEGRVLFAGEDWRRMTPPRAAACRGRIGRVFETGGWINNLDVDENITLAQRHHTLRPVAELYVEAERWARCFGLPEVPRMRAALLKRSELRRAEWIRALMGPPALLLLEQPGRNVPAEFLAGLAAAVQEVRATGSAVIWLEQNFTPWPALVAAATGQWMLEGARLQPREEMGS